MTFSTKDIRGTPAIIRLYTGGGRAVGENELLSAAKQVVERGSTRGASVNVPYLKLFGSLLSAPTGSSFEVPEIKAS